MISPAPARTLCAYFDNRYLDVYEQHVREMAEGGFDGVVHTVTEADLQWRMGRMAELFAATHGAGMQVWADPWGLGGVFGGEATSAHGSASLPELAVLADRWLAAVARAGADWVLWDEPHPRPAGHGRPGADAEEHVVAFLRERCRRAAGSGLQVAVCVADDRVHLIDEIAGWPEVSDVAISGYFFPPMAHHSPERNVPAWTALLAEAARRHGVGTHLWVQGFNLPDGTEDVPVRAIRLARAGGQVGFGFWGFRACDTIDAIRPAWPDVVWTAACAELRAPAVDDAGRAAGSLYS